MSAGQTASQPKATSIHFALQRLTERVEDLINLSERISGDHAKTNSPGNDLKEPPEPIPSLEYILDKTPDAINGICDRLSDVHHSMSEKLF